MGMGWPFQVFSRHKSLVRAKWQSSGLTALAMSASAIWPDAFCASGWGWMLPSTAAPPPSYRKVCADWPTMYSSPRWQCAIRPHKLLCVPVGINRAASNPSMSAMRSCKALTDGSSPNTSSPKGAANMAARMAAVGWVTVSLRRSTTLFMCGLYCKKFFSIAWPCSVRMLSGWNCTPSMRCAKGRWVWRTPMISPSSVQAVMANSGGQVARSMASEW